VQLSIADAPPDGLVTTPDDVRDLGGGVDLRSVGFALGECSLAWPGRVPQDADGLCDNVAMSPAEKFRAALELHEAGVAVMRQNFRRRNPGASAAQIEDLLSAWLRTRPGAEHGDTAGRPSSRLRE
jgi:hypothetical protein